jgi:hypothetical protein
MSYRRQNRCSNCFGVGHTKRSCPSLKERAAEALAKPTNERGYFDQRAIEQVAHYNDSCKNRTCSYCGEVGHNAKGCKIRKSDIETSIDYLINWRKRFIEKCKENGFGVGALVRHLNYSYELGYATPDSPHYCIVTHFDFDQITPWNFGERHSLLGAVMGKNIRNFSARNLDRFGIPNALSDSLGASDRYRFHSDSIELVDKVEDIGFDTSVCMDRKACAEFVEGFYNLKQRNYKPRSRAHIRSAGLLAP